MAVIGWATGESPSQHGTLTLHRRCGEVFAARGRARRGTGSQGEKCLGRGGETPMPGNTSGGYMSERQPGACRGGVLCRDHGATLVESAVVFALIALPILIGILEFGLVFKDWITISHASRESASALAAAADDPVADISALRAIEQSFAGANLNAIGEVRIFNPDGGPVNTYSYTPASACTWSPCPDPDLPGLYIQPPWAPVDRDVEVGNLDRATVEIDLTHNWVTGFFGSTIDLSRSVTNQLEPQMFSS